MRQQINAQRIRTVLHTISYKSELIGILINWQIGDYRFLPCMPGNRTLIRRHLVSRHSLTGIRSPPICRVTCTLPLIGSYTHVTSSGPRCAFGTQEAKGKPVEVVHNLGCSELSLANTMFDNPVAGVVKYRSDSVVP